MNRFSIYFLIGLMLCSVFGLAQKRKNQITQEDTCKGKFTLAKEYYINGEFERSLVSLEDFQLCEKGKNSEYYKLKSEILIVQDNIHDAKICIAYYINSKFENYTSDDDPELFKDLVNEVLDSLSEQTITSLSKKPENVDLATATIIVIKESEFKTRGYSDIIDLLSDQPGFDISRLFSLTYANAFQRGFRQENTERTLLMIDGIEENSVWSNVAFISRQYPLSNISSVEIIYGPASNMYGPRAFAGVINIITKSPKELINSKSKLRLKDNKLDMGITAKMLGGSYNSKGAEINVGGKNKSISFLLTGRFYQTDGRDLSNTAPYYNYDVNDLDNLVYNID